MRTDSLPRLLRALVLGAVFAAPAAALAAEPVDDVAAPAEGPRAALVSEGPERDGGLLPARAFNSARGPIREMVRDARRPVHPVGAGVDYGTATNAFGNARGRPHEGQDIFAPGGTKLLAARDTVVVDQGTDGGRGNWLALYDRERDQTYNYFHMVAPALVETGERVDAGQKVGELGCSGSCQGEHLHFEIREGRGPYGTAIDPLSFLQRAA